MIRCDGNLGQRAEVEVCIYICAFSQADSVVFYRWRGSLSPAVCGTNLDIRGVDVVVAVLIIGRRIGVGSSSGGGGSAAVSQGKQVTNKCQLCQ